MSASSLQVLCDWGSTHLRAFLQTDGEIAARVSEAGIGRLGERSAGQVLEGVLALWRERGRFEQIVLCGMVGSRNGLVEVPYVRAPATERQWRAGAGVVQHAQETLRVLPGIQAPNFRDVMDVMRGEETQIFGALRVHESLREGQRMVVLPGTHSKWVEVRDGRIARLQTYVTGELFELLSTHSSLLRVGSAGGQEEHSEEQWEAFAVGVRNAARFELAANLFETRSAQLIEGRSGQWARALLSGVLIGAEVHGMLGRGTGSTGPITLIGEPALTQRYARVLREYGRDAQQLDGDACALAGLTAAAAGFRECSDEH